MRKSLQELYNKVAGQEVFIIGGGPSLNLIDLSKLNDKLVVCINTAYKLFPNATMLYWCDESFIANHLDAIEKHSCMLRFTARHTADNYILKDIKSTGQATVIKRTGDYGLDTNIDCVKGNNSGAQVLNFLVNMGVYRMVLLGFDMIMKQGKSHWHDGHGLGMHNGIYNDMFIPSINSMAEGIKSMGIDVVNCSEGSALNCFRKENFNDFMLNR